MLKIDQITDINRYIEAKLGGHPPVAPHYNRPTRDISQWTL